MDSTILTPFNLTYDEVDRQADAYVDSLLNQIRTDLQDIKHTLTGDDSPLENCWDEICAHCQGDEFLIWEPYEMTIEGVIEGCFDDLPFEIKLYINFAALVESDYRTDHDYGSYYKEGVLTYLYKKVISLAHNDTNPRVEAYLDPYTREDEESRHDHNEYLLLRIDPAKRESFLKMLDLIEFVENVEMKEKSFLLLYDLLDSIDDEAEHR